MTDFRHFVPAHVRKLAEVGESKPLKQDASGPHSPDSKPIHLNLNENPFGPSPLALSALRSAIAASHRYPEINATDLHHKIAAFHQVAPEQVLVTAGASELLGMIARTLLGPGLNAITSARSFIVYKLAVQVTEGKLIEVATAGNGYDLYAIAKAIDKNTRIVFIANPNNPTGTLLAAEELDEFVNRLPEHVLLVLDEAYGDFAEAFALQRGVKYSQASRYIAEGRNVILLKTFSKTHGLAALRVGYGIGPKALISLFTPTRVVFSVSSAAQAAAAAALHDAAHIGAAVVNNTTESEVMTRSLLELGFRAPETWGNFVFCDVRGSASAFAEQLRQIGIIVQPLEIWGAPNAIRVSIGTPDQNQAFLRALRGIVK